MTIHPGSAEKRVTSFETQPTLSGCTAYGFMIARGAALPFHSKRCAARISLAGARSTGPAMQTFSLNLQTRPKSCARHEVEAESKLTKEPCFRPGSVRCPSRDQWNCEKISYRDSITANHDHSRINEQPLPLGDE
jgi:hypothetical protein